MPDPSRFSLTRADISLWQIFQRIGFLLILSGIRTGKVVILEGPCTEGYANDTQRTLSTESPTRDMFAYTPDNQPVKLNHMVLVIKEGHDMRVPVIAYYTYGIDRAQPRKVFLCYPDIDNEERANDVFGMAAISCGAIRLED